MSGYTWCAGDVFDGHMDANVRHGACTYTFFDGRQLDCQWTHGYCAEFNEVQRQVLAKFSVSEAVLRVVGVGGEGGLTAAVQRFRAAGELHA